MKKLKYVSKEKFAEYKLMDQETLVETLKSQHAHLEVEEGKKKDSQYLREMRSEINQFRKDWAKTQPEKADEIKRLKEEAKNLELERDTAIEADLEEKKELEGVLNEQIAGAKEHIMTISYCLRFNP